jgi:hypothetical protein
MSLLLPDLDALNVVRDRLAPYSRETPILHLGHDPTFIDALGPASDVTFKLEQLQQSGSFNGCSPLPFWIPEEKQMVEYFQPKM